MAKQHWLITTRGKGGGIKVSSLVLSMPVGEVVRTLQGDPKLVNCNSPVCVLKPHCRLKNLLDEALETFYQTLNQYTIDQCINSEHLISLIPIRRD